MNELTSGSDGPTHAPRILRSTSDRWLAGVAGGLAVRFGLRTAVVRGAFVLLTLFGIGPALYVFLAVGLSSDRDPAPRPPARWLLAAVAAALALAPFWVLGVGADVLPIAGWDRHPLRLAALVLLGGVALVVGRRSVPGAGATGLAPAVSRPERRPPTLLLLAIAGAAVVAAALWLVRYEASDVHAFGAILAAALVVVGLGQAVGAWRGDSRSLLPLGVLLAAPLALAGFAGARLDLGTADPGRLAASTATELSYTLGRGARPVVVTRAAAAGGLRRLTLRKVDGTVDVRVAPSVPLRVTVASVGGSGFIVGRDSFIVATVPRVGSRSVLLAATGPTPLPGEPLELRIETGTGHIVVDHGGSTERQPVASTASALGAIRADIAARQSLLARERRTLAGLRARYARGLAGLSSGSPEVGRRVLGAPESVWFEGADSVGVLARDRSLATLTRLRAVRFDLLRAAWRVRTVDRGIAERRRELVARARVAPRPAPRVAPPTPTRPGRISGPDAPPPSVPTITQPAPPTRRVP